MSILKANQEEKKTLTLKHQKHHKLSRPSLGMYGRTEWAVYGTGCTKISEFCNSVISALNHKFNLAYLDGDHSQQREGILKVDEKQFHFDRVNNWSTFDDIFIGRQFDAILVNGNHFPADHQIIIIDPNKEGSLQKRKDQLTNVEVVITQGQKIPQWLENNLTDTTRIVDDIQDPCRVSEVIFQP